MPPRTLIWTLDQERLELEIGWWDINVDWHPESENFIVDTVLYSQWIYFCIHSEYICRWLYKVFPFIFLFLSDLSFSFISNLRWSYSLYIYCGARLLSVLSAVLLSYIADLSSAIDWTEYLVKAIFIGFNLKYINFVLWERFLNLITSVPICIHVEGRNDKFLTLICSSDFLFF